MSEKEKHEHPQSPVAHKRYWTGRGGGGSISAIALLVLGLGLQSWQGAAFRSFGGANAIIPARRGTAPLLPLVSPISSQLAKKYLAILAPF